MGRTKLGVTVKTTITLLVVLFITRDTLVKFLVFNGDNPTEEEDNRKDHNIGREELETTTTR